MPRLSLIVGPPNSGKAGEITKRLRAALPRDPVLVVPTRDDVSRFELQLCAGSQAGRPVLGAAIRTFGQLFGEVAMATGAPLPPPLTSAQVLHLMRRAAARAELGILRRSARRAGFAPALAALVEELQAAAIDPGTLAADAADAEGSAAYLGELARLYAAYAEAREELGRGDAHVIAGRATAALRARPEGWGGRPVLFYGFDDLTVEQLELVSALARAGDVTFAVPYEDRRAYAARARLLERLRERGGVVERVLEPDPANTESRTLYELERRFLRDGAAPVALDEGVVALEAAGERGQAEQIGAEVARLLADGEPPDEIAVVVRDPDRDGPLLGSTFDALRIPAAVEAKVPLVATAAGRALVALARAAGERGSAADLLAFVRAPGVAGPGDADWLERRILRGRLRVAADAAAAWQGRDLFELDELVAARSAPDPGGFARTLARHAGRIAAHPWHRKGEHGDAAMRLELRAGAVAAAALRELAELPAVDGPADDAVAALEALEVPLWQGPSEGRVQVTSPYRIRARRVRHLFVASLQEGEFPRHATGEPFISDEQRAQLRLPERADPDDEERYLFAVCLSRPARRLHLCWRSSDDEGAELSPSPFVDDVRDLLGRAPGDAADPLAPVLRRRRLGDVVAPVGEAASHEELARALAAWAPGADPGAVGGVAPATAAELRARLDRARERAARDEPGPLRLPEVLAELAGRRLFGASTLESYAECSYRWFVQHELAPRELEPEPEPRAQGSVIHRVLERLYREPPAGAVPEPATLPTWRGRAAELVAELAAEHGLGGDDPRGVAARARMLALVEAQLEREAGTVTSLRPDPELLEAGFGEREDDIAPALELGDEVQLHGKIDRVDVSPGGDAGLVRDYKVARDVTKGANLVKEGKLQPQLYAMALQRLWHKRPLGGLYQPLAGTKTHTPRGIAVREEAETGGLIAGLGLVRGDLLGADELKTALDTAAAEARRIAGEMRAGRIDRDPLGGSCPRWCTFQSICRRERAPRIEVEPSEEEEEAAA